MPLIKRELTRCSIGGDAASTVSVNYESLTGAVTSVEVQTQASAVRLLLTHLTLPALNVISAIAANTLSVIPLGVGYLFSPTDGKDTAGSFPGAEIQVFWEL